MSKVYLAALYSTMDEMKKAVSLLEQAGHTSVARWINGIEEGQTREAGAKFDLDDMEKCDTLLHFALPKGTYYKGGGRQFEFGYCYARGKRCFIVGQKGEHVFHYSPNILHFETLEEAIAAL